MDAAQHETTETGPSAAAPDAVRRTVVVASDTDYVVPLHACLSSVTSHTRGLDIRVLDCGLTARQRDALRATVDDAGSLVFVKVPAGGLDGLPRPACNSMATYARLRIEDFTEEGRVIYLDADTLTRASIGELFEVQLEGRALAAVREMYTPTVSSDHGVTGWRTLGLAPDTSYFNAGVMVIDLARWSELGVGVRALEYLRRDDVVINLFDQEALNVVLAGEWLELPTIWNVSRYWYKEERRPGSDQTILEDARIFHYLSEDKPWIVGNSVPEPQTNEFFAAIDQSAVAGWRPDPERNSYRGS
jgi:lipopolysaccharide biosynthesis glycosyltransferase